MFKIVQITKENSDNKEIRDLYESSFPEEEKLKYEDIFHHFDGIQVDFKAYYDEEEHLVAIYISYVMKKYTYAAFLAVVEKLRGKGYGKKIVLDIIEGAKTGNIVIGEVESPSQTDSKNLEIRKRRLAFYLRNGAVDTGIHIKHNGVDYAIVTTTKEPIPEKDIEELAEILKPLNDIFPTYEQ